MCFLHYNYITDKHIYREREMECVCVCVFPIYVLSVESAADDTAVGCSMPTLRCETVSRRPGLLDQSVSLTARHTYKHTHIHTQCMYVCMCVYCIYITYIHTQCMYEYIYIYVHVAIEQIANGYVDRCTGLFR